MRLLTAAEAAQILRVSPRRIYDMAREGILPPGVAIRLGRELRISESRLAEFLEAGGCALAGGWRRES